MFHMKYLFYSILLQLINSAPQLNLYYTDLVSESENDVDNLQHNCLHVVDPKTTVVADASISKTPHPDLIVVAHGAVFYCMGELPSKFPIKMNDLFSNFTFGELSKQNITSEQLFIWSAPIDVIERYEFYLDQLSKSVHDLTMEAEIFYKCPLPRFGHMCQYELEYYDTKYRSLYELINDFYQKYKYHPTTLTCYTHLKCNRGSSPSCLDWTEICDGVIDCIDNGLDEEHCWQLEINECNENEFRCKNGQCISQSFYGDREKDTHDCIDGSDYVNTKYFPTHLCEFNDISSFRCEDISCERNGLTSSCIDDRQHLLVEAMFSTKDESISDKCWSAFKCIMYIYKDNDPTCDDICRGNKCVRIIESECPDTMFIPTVPFLFSNIYLAYQKNDSKIFQNGKLQYLYMCYNNSYYDNYFSQRSKILINNITCHSYPSPTFQMSTNPSNQQSISDIYTKLWKYYQVYNYTSIFCNRSNMYQCANSSKCISIHRRNNKIEDCPQGDDENSSEILDISLIYPFNSIDRYDIEIEKRNVQYMRMNISFQTICNGYTELFPININGKNETDETECEQWECNNIYTRCNNFWNCHNGEDELNCDLSTKLSCYSNNHICVSPHTYQLMCLPIEKANDGYIDCLGGTDERKLCRKNYEFEYPDNFYCVKGNSTLCINGEKLCNGRIDCEHGDDEKFCEDNSDEELDGDYCTGRAYWSGPTLTDVDKVLCQSLKIRLDKLFVFFSLLGTIKTYEISTKNIENKVFSRSSIIEIPHQYKRRCHHGINLRVWLNKTNYLPTCLCPPNFYGNKCQYQNQRVILSIKFRATSHSWQILFSIIIFLIDNSEQQIIHSYDQFTYLSTIDCEKKFNVYLLYSIRPKNESKNYSIHIDIYEKFSLTFRGSLLYPIKFQFLPINRLVFYIDIPQNNDNENNKCSNHECVNGICMKYSNNKNISFCHCKQGWTGRYCTISFNCTCSNDSLCIGITAHNRSICVCHPNKFGPRCLINTPCQINNNSICQNNGQCIPDNEYLEYKQGYRCICPKGFTGKQCEKKETEIRITFEKDIILSQSIFIHFIEVKSEDFPIRSTTFATIPKKQDILIIYWSQHFRLAFIEIPMNNYYLVVIRTRSFVSTSTLKKQITSYDRCPHIREIFNETFLQWHLIRQIKYYHLACQIYSFNLSCFYDNVQFCLCYTHEQKRLANCFDFQHNMTMDCSGVSECENKGKCFQDNPTCPKRTICLCEPCFYGRLCQFRTSGFGLTLDGILGYHIEPRISIINQSISVKISIGLTIIFLLVGFLNGLFSIITFKSKIIQEVGCGIYLFGSSITTLFITIIFGFKFWILILSQMNIISNKLFLSLQCYSIDFILRISLNMDQWLNSFVAVERAYTSIKGIYFNKKKSKQIAKLVIIIILIINIGTSLHDPIYRKLIEEENDGDNEKRTWCIVTYSYNLHLFNSVVYTFHFLGPFIINIVSSIILIIKKTMQQSKIHPHRSFKILLQVQVQEHKHLLIAPILLVILAIPRLIISFTSKCMKSANDSWIFLIGYFISFIPPMLTYFIFILPSTFYKNELRKIITQYKINIQRRLHLIS